MGSPGHGFACSEDDKEKMGKRAQIRREKKEYVQKVRKETLRIIERSKNPWENFWRTINFWIYCACFIAIIAFPFIKKDTMNGIENAVIYTSMGDIEIELYSKDAPKTVENFVELSKQGFYDNLTWHRVIKGFMIQGGDPKGDGTGGESAFGGTFEDEINATALGLDKQIVKNTPSVSGQIGTEDLEKYGQLTVKEYYEQIKGYQYSENLKSHKMQAGSIAMANSGADTNGSQFFIITEQDQPHLDGMHTVFGRVTKGLDIALKISEVPVDDSDKPIDPVMIQSVEIVD